jgi:pSer/pThr/pTyr-binding forkhead associated (FHA) protein
MRLVVTSEVSKGSVYELEEGDNLLGRWDPNTGAFPEVDLEEVDPDARVSRKHAIIDRNAGRAWLRDIGSLNGTILNGQKLQTAEVVELCVGDVIQIGRISMRFESRALSGRMTVLSATLTNDEE